MYVQFAAFRPVLKRKASGSGIIACQQFHTFTFVYVYIQAWLALMIVTLVDLTQMIFYSAINASCTIYV